MKSSTNPHTNNTDIFYSQLKNYRQQIDTRIEQYHHHSYATTTRDFGPNSAQAYSAFTSILSRGGKRIRGVLTMEAYRMFGGQDQQVALQAALVMEMIQAYLLIIDDVCDRSQVRRGGPTAHILLEDWHQQQKWKDDSAHFGQSIATLAAILGMHEAMLEADKLDVSADIRLAAIRNLNHCLAVTAHGQFNDIFNQVSQASRLTDIENVLVWKTAYYTFINPLQFGALLAGVDQSTLQSLIDFSINAGRAFQLSDDLIGVFVDGEDSGKSPLDDLREGKQTLQIQLALQSANPADRHYLQHALGKQSLDQADLQRCRQIIIDTGAYDQVRSKITDSLDAARQGIANLDNIADQPGLDFLHGLTLYLEERQA